MNNNITHIEFNSLSLAKKIQFFDSDIAVNAIQSMSEIELNKYLKNIILDKSENSFVKIKAQRVYIDCVFLDKIKKRQALSVLIDEWEISNNIFIEKQRIQDLYLFYYEEKENIEQILKKYTENDEIELVSEAYVNLGLIYMQECFSSDNEEDFKKNIGYSKDYFVRGKNSIENRIDAEYYFLTLNIIEDYSNKNNGKIKSNLDKMAEILFTYNKHSFGLEINSFDLGFYRILSSFFHIENDAPSKWLDFRSKLKTLSLKYSEILNSKIKGRLKNSLLSSFFISLVKEKFIEPYFALNFVAEMDRIDILLKEYENDNEVHDLLLHIKRTANNENKKKEDTKEFRAQLIRAFPLLSSDTIDKELEYAQPSTSEEYLSLFQKFNTPSVDTFIDKLIYCCFLLQQDRKYRGNYSENDRNTYIANMLKTAEYFVSDQTRASISQKGKDAGELDIVISDKQQRPFTIIEALNLKSTVKNTINTHISKTFIYDTVGYKFNVILIYYEEKNFISFWSKYISYVSKKMYQYKTIGTESIDSYNYTDIKIFCTTHIRQEQEVSMYHIAINLPELIAVSV